VGKMGKLVTVSAKIPEELSIRPSEIIRKAIEEEVYLREVEKIKEMLEEAEPILAKLSVERAVRSIREDRGSR